MLGVGVCEEAKEMTGKMALRILREHLRDKTLSSR